MALDWEKPIYVLKLDIRKAFDIVVQARLGDLLFERLAVKGKPWEARLWLQLVQCDTLLVQTDGGNINIQQTNGVRQGSPDSPVLFAALMGESIGDILACGEEGETSLPFISGVMYMDDTYLWAESLSFLQQQIRKVEQRLAIEGLHINGDKTECVCAHPKPGETILVGGQTVQVRDPNPPIKVLGAPLTATMQQKARAALASNKATFRGKGSLSHKAIMSDVLIRPSALWGCGNWPCHAALLQAASTVQLRILRDSGGLPRWGRRGRNGTKDPQGCAGSTSTN